MILDYAGYDRLENTIWTSTNGSAYGNETSSPYNEIITFGAVTLYNGYKLIACEYKVKQSKYVGYLYVPESLVTKFIFGNTRCCHSDSQRTPQPNTTNLLTKPFQHW